MNPKDEIIIIHGYRTSFTAFKWIIGFVLCTLHVSSCGSLVT